MERGLTYGEVLLAAMLAVWFVPPPWRFRGLVLLLVLTVGAGG